MFYHLLLFLLLTPLLPQTQTPTSLQIKIIDDKQQPIFGVYVIKQTQALLLTTSDIDGECKLNVSQYQVDDSIVFQGLGYITRTICIKDLMKDSVVVLQELNYDLSEATVQAIPTKQILTAAARQLKKKKAARIPVCRFYASGLYEKQVICKDTVVEYRREAGYYFTSGNIIPKNTWDETYRSYFVPEYIARSYNLSLDGRDTLIPSFMTAEQIRYDVGTRKIFTLIRAIELYGPLFSDLKTYDITPIQSDSSDYAFQFQTSPDAYPQKTRISCKGILYIDREHFQLTQIDFDYIDYQLLRQILLSDKRKTTSPFSTKASIRIVYDSLDNHHISLCRQITSWKYDLGNNFILLEQPSRHQPGIQQLVEKEILDCRNYLPIPSRYQNQEMLSKIHLAFRFPTGRYAPEIFSHLPVYLLSPKARKDLERFMPLEDQYIQNSDKPYYPENNIQSNYTNFQEQATYLKNLSHARKQILEIFGKKTPINSF